MPLYVYECGACKEAFETRHSIKEDLEKCILCLEPDSLKRIPAMPIIIKKEKGRPTKTGQLVKKFIEEAREDLKSEKREIKEKSMYDVD